MQKKKVAKKKNKKPLVALAAYLEVCTVCHTHAVIVTASRKTTKNFYSKKSGRELIEQLLIFKHIDRKEWIYLQASLDASALIEENPLEEPILSFDDAMCFEEADDNSETPQHKEWIN